MRKITLATQSLWPLMQHKALKAITSEFGKQTWPHSLCVCMKGMLQFWNWRYWISLMKVLFPLQILNFQHSKYPPPSPNPHPFLTPFPSKHNTCAVSLEDRQRDSKVIHWPDVWKTHRNWIKSQNIFPYHSPLHFKRNADPKSSLTTFPHRWGLRVYVDPCSS